MTRSDAFFCWFHATDAAGRPVLTLYDLFHSARGPYALKTVTNDAERVVAQLVAFQNLKPGVRLIYCDTEGRWDEILVREGAFAGFGSLGGVRTLKAALAASPATSPITPEAAA